MSNLSKRKSIEADNRESKKLKSNPNQIDMFCWGSTVHGELGLGGIEDENIPVPRELNFEKATQIQEIACGENYTVVITNNGQVYSCGNNDYGQLGHDKPKKRLQLIPGLDAFTFKKAACGASHTLAVNEWGQLFSWGSNSDGQLGLNTTNIIESTPSMVKTLGTSVIIQISCGLKHVIALTNNSELYAWGSNSDGQLGLGSNISSTSKPILISTLSSVPISFITCGGYHTIVVTKSGGIYGWGRNTFGQIGVNNTTNVLLPCQLRTLRNTRVRYVSCGENFTAFLTIDGGVFTCGAGMYGQLGHGNKNNEILPRKVMELMGSIVTQISCGKRHMLAFVPSRGRVYAWGLGGAGQLGIRATISVTTPQVVLGPWVSPNGSAIYKVDTPISDYSANCVVRHIFSGGNHCFVTVTKREENIEPDDCRILDASTQILTITEKHINTCQKIPMGAPLDHELLTYLETIFQSQACINASFLLPNDEHYGCSSKHSGVDFEQASRYFGLISDIQNNTIRELIFTSIVESLIPSLAVSPPDVESLRVYATLPFYHGFSEPTKVENLQKPFARAVLSLKPEAKKIVGLWWTKAPVQLFHRLIRSYKNIVIDILKKGQAESQNNKSQVFKLDGSSLVFILDMLQFINELNTNDNQGLHVPYELFHIHELIEIINIRADYLRWLRSNDSTSKYTFCNYPFLFDAQAKTLLLETDQSLQMNSAMHEGVTRGLPIRILSSLLHNPFQLHLLTLNVSRDNIVADTLKELTEKSPNDLKKPLKVKFHNEEAEDAGGVKKEFFLLLLREILDPKYGMFKQYDETNTIWFSEDTLEDESMYFLIGIICGLAIYNFTIIDLPFPLALYKKLLGEKICLSDVDDLSPVLGKSLQNLLDYNDDDFEEVFCLNFQVSREAFGEQRVYELIKNGSNVPVTNENKKEFVDLYVDYIFNKSVEKHFSAFYNGFHKVCGSTVLKLFRSHELMAVIVGNENYDWKELEANATYKEGYTENDPTIKIFWQVFHELPLEEKKKFLLFLTGSDRIPIQGMKAIKIIIQPLFDDKFLPVAHTCFNLLDLPRYQTRERLRYKLLQAIQQTQGFSLV
ncbi:hypothetical protein HCN44_004263 [Aphidius gifuensis]|uniref:HECT domain-containing protein n=1 Tax=Aphidius gifuensis TaxID=684658 RepID=A0A834XYV4_APHGI|nr:probable E3 ubiquitin-protein ligase HERC4 isoform X2 [Aphidius gifuensis]XP_044002586.1 probable E3 ubiquitin-protein ligase HERC4 isoform X2 [Aphidius gifuensis]KAF7994791.1 hypothetical protein HCN44_004263 [Aphidius gifuensis]